MSYHDEVINITVELLDAPKVQAEREHRAYRIGHCDARYVAAEIALHADKRIEALEKALRNARSLITAYVGTKTRAKSILDLFKQISDVLEE